ncbi:hypothetical protein AUP43_00170 [Oceanibaculum pacificum]|uniref:TMEM205-like domain-containing protein n=2 Tax=Oceanibaculum pacificum TaxID=580166 RepID=A0A154WGX5_9PROT|nr:hypothetical protein AUP43_00170 [Oceanibaculum pacificum]
MIEHMTFLSPLAALFTALVLGGMLCFAAVFAPLIFIKLPAETAGPFIRQVFPVYYLAMALGCVPAALLALPVNFSAAAALLLVILGFVYARQGLMPKINRLRDRQLAGDAAAATRFDRLHRLSVLLNLGQMAVLLYAFLLLTGLF